MKKFSFTPSREIPDGMIDRQDLLQPRRIKVLEILAPYGLENFDLGGSSSLEAA